LQGIISNCSVS